MKTTNFRIIIILIASFCLTPQYAQARNKRSKSSSSKSIKRKRYELKTEEKKLPTAADGWKDACSLTSDLTDKVKPALLGNKDPKAATWQMKGSKYVTLSHGRSSYGQVMNNFYFDEIIRKNSITEVAASVKKCAQKASEYRGANKPLLKNAEKVELGLKALWLDLAANKLTDLKPLQVNKFSGSGSDELSFAMQQLSAAVASGNLENINKWVGEAYGAASRLADLLRWVDLQTEWLEDLSKIFFKFEDCINKTEELLKQQPGASWKNFMFGRLPAAQSIQHILCGEVPMAEHLLSDFYVVSAADKSAMGTLDIKSEYFSVIPELRAAFKQFLDAQKSKDQNVIIEITKTDFELSALNSNLWRYKSENCIPQLTESVKLYFKNHKKPDICSLMEVIHISQGAWGASTSAADRYHPEVLKFAAKLKGKKDRDAAKEAHDLAYKFYTWDGKPHYKGGIWTLTDAFQQKAVDCIRVSQLIGCIYANAGYSGIHPIRIARGNRAKGMVAVSGHTFVNFDEGKKNICLDGLLKNSLLKPYESMHAGDNNVVSCALAYRGLHMFSAGEIYFPQGPDSIVQLRVPYYRLARHGIDK